jgi:hypothetical protein
MESEKDYVILRKTITTLSTSFILAYLLTITGLIQQLTDGEELSYHTGNDMVGWFLVYLFYVGAVIAVYGNFVSVILDAIRKKWLPNMRWLFVFFHGILGLINGLFFQDTHLAYYGMAAAMLYACIDWWVERRIDRKKSTKVLLIIPLILSLLSWSILEALSPSLPPFTKEDAIEFATSGEGTDIDLFPAKVGTWKGAFGGYQIERKTRAKKLNKEFYLVTFEENWTKGKQKGRYVMSYKVDRSSVSGDGGSGTTPPYYEKVLEQ